MSNDNTKLKHLHSICWDKNLTRTSLIVKDWFYNTICGCEVSLLYLLWVNFWRYFQWLKLLNTRFNTYCFIRQKAFAGAMSFSLRLWPRGSFVCIFLFCWFIWINHYYCDNLSFSLLDLLLIFMFLYLKTPWILSESCQTEEKHSVLFRNSTAFDSLKYPHYSLLYICLVWSTHWQVI